MAEALLRPRVPLGVAVQSAGLLPGGAPATELATAVVRGLEEHVSREVSSELIEGADLIVGMSREHVREIAASVPASLRRTFTLKELVRRGSSVGPRKPGDTVGDWLDRVGAGRVGAELLGSSPDDDVADPIGQPRGVYEETAAELDGLTRQLAWLLWSSERAG